MPARLREGRLRPTHAHTLRRAQRHGRERQEKLRQSLGSGCCNAATPALRPVAAHALSRETHLYRFFLCRGLPRIVRIHVQNAGVVPLLQLGLNSTAVATVVGNELAQSLLGARNLGRKAFELFYLPYAQYQQQYVG